MKTFNIHITGVGGQGIGLLSQALLRGIDHAGIQAISVDTHGLAQRGGVVVSRIRCGSAAHSPLIMKNRADLVLGMEVHEAMRSLNTALRPGGTLVFLDVSWQPLPVRLKQAQPVTAEDIGIACATADVKMIKTDIDRLPDARMQNMALLGTVAANHLIPGVEAEHFAAALEDLLESGMLLQNRTLFESYANR